MKLTVLCDNNTYIDAYYLGEPAFSCLVEDGAHTVLFDTGYSNVFIQNADALHMDLGRVTDIVISHGHNDHTGGLLPYLERFHQRVRLYAHPRAFEKKRLMELDIGSPLSLGDLPSFVEPHLSCKPQRISEHLTFLGEIPRIYAFERDRAVGESLADGKWIPDQLLDDSAVSMCTSEGQFLLTGCSHSGICNIVSAAKGLFPNQQIAGILGGLHLFRCGPAMDATIAELKRFSVKRLYPCHCTTLPVKAALIKDFPVEEVGVSMTLALDEANDSK